MVVVVAVVLVFTEYLESRHYKIPYAMKDCNSEEMKLYK